MREKFESEAWCYEVGSSSGKGSNENILTGGGGFLGGEGRGNEFQTEITRGRKFLKSDYKAKGSSRVEDVTRYGEKGNSQGGTTKDGEFL